MGSRPAATISALSTPSRCRIHFHTSATTTGDQNYTGVTTATGNLSTTTSGSVIFTGTAIPATTKGHLALVRTGASSPYTWTLYWQGTSIGSGTATTVDDGTTNRTITFGNFNSATQPAVTCKLDDIRVTKGVSRYTGSFTPPTVPYGP